MNREHLAISGAGADARRGACRSVIPALSITVTLLAGSAAARAQSGFSLGVAAGDVRDTSAIIWTRADWLSVVRFELAADEAFAAVEQSGVVLAAAENDFGVRVRLTDLSPGTDYFYRFVAEGDPDQRSRVGRFRTAPRPEHAATLRFVFSGDMGFGFAPFTLVSQVVDEQADFLLWFGDTIYADDPAAAEGVATTLEAYRAKYREIRSDPHVREALAALPVWVGWDDHEVTDDYAGTDPALPGEQLAAAYQAFFEYMPLEEQQIADDTFRTYRRFRWGSQVEFFLLDGRQYREPSVADACGYNPDPLGTVLGPLLADEACAAQLSEERSLLGSEQFEWLTQGLLESTANVKFVANDVQLSFIGLLPYDGWDGYDAERRALLEFIDAHGIEGVVFLTTNFHASWYNPDVTRYFRRQRPDYDLPNEVPVVEAIVGPLGFETLHETAIGTATGVLGLPGGPVARGVLTGIEQQVARRLQCISGFTLAETNRLSYVVVEVSPGGEVEITYRGIGPGEAQSSEVAAETFYTVPAGSSPALPCCLPLVLAGLAGWPVLVARRGGGGD